MKPKRAILTNLHSDLDYEALRAQLPSGVEPAYDGMRFEAPKVISMFMRNALLTRETGAESNQLRWSAL